MPKPGAGRTHGRRAKFAWLPRVLDTAILTGYAGFMPSTSLPCDGQLTEVVTRLRRALRTGLRAEYTWESLPMTHVEILHTLAEQPGIRVSDMAVELRLAQSTVSSLIRQMAAEGL